MKKIFSVVLKGLLLPLRPLGWLLFLGTKGEERSSEIRTTVFTNAMSLWGVLGILSISSFLVQNNLAVEHISFFYTFEAILALLIIILNGLGYTFWARVLGVVLMNFIVYQAGINFGKSFNGYLLFPAALMYGIIAFSRESNRVKWFLVSLSVSSPFIVDFLHLIGAASRLGIHSADYPFSVLVTDSFVAAGMVAIMVGVEKYYSNKYESEIQRINENLENIVEERTEMLRKATEEAEKADAMKTQFVANTSHELRTPVQGISGFIGMARVRLGKFKELNEEQTKITEKIEKSLGNAESSSNRLLELVDTLLQVTRAEDISFKPRPRLFGLLQIIKKVVVDFEPQLLEKNITVNVNEINKDFEMNTDSVMLSQVLSNVIGNAIRYGNNDSEVLLRLHEISDGQIQIDVENSGVGVREDETEKIFQPFERGSAVNKDDGGAGLGLSMCQKYMSAIQGSVSLVSGEAEKTIFGISFPKKLELGEG